MFRFQMTKEASELGGDYTLLPIGKYLATVVNVNESSTRWIEFEFKILAGEYTGKVVKERIFLPQDDQDPEKAEKTLNRLGLVLSNLGLWDGKKGGIQVQFQDAVGCNVVIDVTTRKYLPSGGGNEVTVNTLTWNGILSLTSDKLTAKEKMEFAKAMRQLGGQAEVARPAALPKARSTTTQAPKQEDFSDF